MKFIDLEAQYNFLKKEINENISNMLAHGQYIMGKEVELFEDKLAEFVGRKHVISCANGTDALQIAFMAYGIGEKDAVFCPDVTFIASVEPAAMLGAVPVFCDITKDTYNLCPESLEMQINNVIRRGEHNPKAVVAVDFLGNPADYDKITQICKKYDLILIEDAAQSMGATYKNKNCCAFGNIATTSFFPAKPLGCYGDGGAIFTDDDAIAEICRSIRVHGKGASKYDNIRIGMNSRLDTLQAAILLPKLNALKTFEVDKRHEIAKKYNEAFKENFTIPYVEKECTSIYAQYALLAESTNHRDNIIDILTKNNIPNMVYYPTPQHLLKVFEVNEYVNCDYSNSIHYCSHTFSIPMSAYISEEDQNTIIKEVVNAR